MNHVSEKMLKYLERVSPDSHYVEATRGAVIALNGACEQKIHLDCYCELPQLSSRTTAMGHVCIIISLDPDDEVRTCSFCFYTIHTNTYKQGSFDFLPYSHLMTDEIITLMNRKNLKPDGRKIPFLKEEVKFVQIGEKKTLRYGHKSNTVVVFSSNTLHNGTELRERGRPVCKKRKRGCDKPSVDSRQGSIKVFLLFKNTALTDVKKPAEADVPMFCTKQVIDFMNTGIARDKFYFNLKDRK